MGCEYLGELVRSVFKPCCNKNVNYYNCSKRGVLIRVIDCEKCEFNTGILPEEREIPVSSFALPRITRSRNGISNSK